MRHGIAQRHLARTSAHRLAMRRNMAQSLFQYGQIETTLVKAKDLRPFVEKMITLARQGTLRARQRLESELTDRSVISKDDQEAYDGMSDAQRGRVLFSRSGRRHRTGQVPAAYDKNKYKFVAQSVIHKLMAEIAPRYQDRPGGYTRIIRLPKRRIGDASELAILQLVGDEEGGQSPRGDRKKQVGVRRTRALTRIKRAEGKGGARKKSRGESKPAAAGAPAGNEGDATEST